MVTTLLLAVGLLAQTDGAAESSPEQRLEFARQAAGRYRLVVEDAPARLHPQPLLRWDNQVVREDDGLLFLWTEKSGRPLAAAQFFLQGDIWHHEFQSLSEHGFAASCQGDKDWSWQPKGAGVHLAAAVERDNPPAKTAAGRLRIRVVHAQRAAAPHGAGDTLLNLLRQFVRHLHEAAFLQHIDAQLPPTGEVHVIMDNYGTHQVPKVARWFVRHPRYHVHFTPTSASWLNQVERFFSIITTRAIRRGSFNSVKDLTQKIDRFVANYNQSCKPFSWTATADSILEKLARLCGRINGTGH